MGIRAYRPGTRGQSGPLGVILVFAVVIASSTAVVALGAGAISNSESHLDVERTEKVLTQLDSQGALVALGRSRSQRVDLAATGSNSYGVHDEAGWMNISYDDTDGNRNTIFNTTMGAVVYEGSGETTLAYQGGGVWRSGEGNGSVLISPPEFHYRKATLTLPLVTLSGDDSLDNRAVVTHNESTQYFPNTDLDPAFQNPLEGGKVNVTVHSKYYQAWGTHFDERTDGDVFYDHPNETVTIELTVPIKAEFDNVVATTEPGGIEVKGSDPPPNPYQDGVTYPAVDEEVEEEIDDCRTGSPCNETNPNTLDNSETYYYDSDFSGTLDIDNPGGNVSIVVNGGFNPDSVTIKDVDEDHSVNIYVRDDFDVDGGDPVNVDNGDPTELKVLVHSDGEVNFNGQAEFVGVLFAPASHCDLNGNSEIKGALICETMKINGNPNEFNYDPAVEDANLGLDYSDATRITYLHVSVNDVNVTSG